MTIILSFIIYIHVSDVQCGWQDTCRSSSRPSVSNRLKESVCRAYELNSASWAVVRRTWEIKVTWSIVDNRQSHTYIIRRENIPTATTSLHHYIILGSLVNWCELGKLYNSMAQFCIEHSMSMHIYQHGWSRQQNSVVYIEPVAIVPRTMCHRAYKLVTTQIFICQLLTFMSS